MSEAKLLIRQKDGVLIASFDRARIAGELLIQQIGAQLQDLVAQAAQERRLLLDFSGVEFMSSLMIGQIIRLQRHCQQGDIRLKLCNIALGVLETFKITGLTKLLEIHPDDVQALAAFGPLSPASDT